MNQPSTSDYQYPGAELDLFARATNWKAYWAEAVRPWVKGRVLDLGCGIGNNINLLLDPQRVDHWLAADPDPKLIARTQELYGDKWGARLESSVSTAADLVGTQPAESFDSLLYIDVLEHIEADVDELRTSTRLLRPGGALVILSPAMPFLYSPFDAAVGHYRRYTKASLQKVIPSGMIERQLRYMDSTGCLLSAGNRLLLRQGTPDQKQIQFWDRFIIPVSRLLDPILAGSIGRSVVGIWIKS
jgi:2-polyprenyl-3-methyl-5-hydroxy-6-metoxy-1,4-benzoquinol methylase